MPNDRRAILQLILDDQSTTAVERVEAKKLLAGMDGSPPPAPRRRSARNLSAPITQADSDADVEGWYHRDLVDQNLTSTDRNEIFNGFDISTRAILDAFGSNILWLFTNNEAEVPILIEAATNSQSAFVRAKALTTLGAIAGY